MSESPNFVWEHESISEGLGGIATDGKRVVFGGRDLLDSSDTFTCLNASTGKVLWQIIYPATGRLDYGNSPRGTPLINNGHVYLQGGFGQITCANLETGETVWEKNLAMDYAVAIPTWGFCGSPIIVEERLIVQTPARDASLVALDPKTGEVIWQTEGGGTGYSSLMAGTLGNTFTIVGYQETSIAGWDAGSGKLLWEIKPKHDGDFNVPTPIIEKQNLWLISENNGLRRYPVENGKLNTTPAKQNTRITPDSHSPVKVNDRIYILNDGLYCVDADNLTKTWTSEDLVFNVYGSIIASDTRLLVTTFSGDLVLVDATADSYQPIGQWKLIDDGSGMYSHPAIAGTKLFIRLGKRICCIELAPDN